MTENDRLSIVMFESHATRLTPLQKVTPYRADQISQLID